MYDPTTGPDPIVAQKIQFAFDFARSEQIEIRLCKRNSKLAFKYYI